MYHPGTSSKKRFIQPRWRPGALHVSIPIWRHLLTQIVHLWAGRTSNKHCESSSSVGVTNSNRLLSVRLAGTSECIKVPLGGLRSAFSPPRLTNGRSRPGGIRHGLAAPIVLIQPHPGGCRRNRASALLKERYWSARRLRIRGTWSES